MHEHGSLPRARQDDLLAETVGDELLLYDRNSHVAHCLSPIAACVWRHCDGEHNLTELAELAGVAEDLIASALDELHQKDLLDAEPPFTHDADAGISRREVIVRGARYGAAAAAVPLIISATAATPAMAASNCNNNHCVVNAAENCCVCKNGNECKNARNEEVCKNECNEAGRGGMEYWGAGCGCKA